MATDAQLSALKWLINRNGDGVFEKNRQVLVAAGDLGEVIRVIRDAPGGVAYHIHFDCQPGRLLQIPEGLLDAAGSPE